jgi:hypothetical protein
LNAVLEVGKALHTVADVTKVGISRRIAGIRRYRLRPTEALAGTLGLRIDIPIETLRELLSKTTAAVRAQLLKAASPELRARIRDATAEQVGINASEPVDYTEAQNTALVLNRAGKLGDQTVNRSQYRENNLYLIKLESIQILLRAYESTPE